jgi:chromosomal replication initiation ATPase DnaA
MTGPSRQLALDLPTTPRYGRADFLVSGCNEAAMRMIDLWPRWPDRLLLVTGPEGAGKSHLAAIWAQTSGARVAPAGGPLPAPDATADDRPIVIEDADRLRGDEADLFHLINRLRAQGTFMLMTARSRPDHWGLGTADVLSRLRLAPTVEIGAPDEALMRSVLVKLIGDRQLLVEAGVVDYIARRIDRSLGAARMVVAELDRESLALGRRITRLMAGGVLKRQSDDGSE